MVIVQIILKKTIGTSLFVGKPYLRPKYIGASIEEDIDMNNQFRIKTLTDPISIRETASKNYTDNKFHDPSIIKTPLMLILTIKISIMFVLSK